jgi:hypothetical protein
MACGNIRSRKLGVERVRLKEAGSRTLEVGGAAWAFMFCKGVTVRQDKLNCLFSADGIQMIGLFQTV